MKMGPRCATGASDAGNDLSRLHPLPGLDQTLLEMEVHGVQAQTMIQKDRGPGEEVVGHQCHYRPVGGVHWCACGRCEIRPGMRRPRLPIDDPPDSESRRRSRLVQRKAKRPVPELGGRHHFPKAVQGRLLAVYPLERRRIQLHKRTGHGEALDGEVRIQDLDRPLARQGAAASIHRLGPDKDGARDLPEIDADQEHEVRSSVRRGRVDLSTAHVNPQRPEWIRRFDTENRHAPLLDLFGCDAKGEGGRSAGL